MSEKKVDRRGFLKTSLATSGAAIGLSLEDKALLAQNEQKPKFKATGKGKLPTGKIGNVEISRIICGGNLVAGYAHSRDLIYVSPLLKHYFTFEKILETLEIAEENGVNTVVLNNQQSDNLAIEVLKAHWKNGGKMQWLAQCSPDLKDHTTNIKSAVDTGAVGAFILGNVGDEMIRSGHVDVVKEIVEFTKDLGVIAGVGGHNLRTTMICEKEGVDADFYMKTFHSTKYWSTRRPDQEKDVIDNYGADNYWDKNLQKTMEFMKTVKRPWIAYKVLAAGALHPRDGFKFAFEGGADFCCVGMFDFQVVQDVDIANKILASKSKRQRPWLA
jgi:hypothetical protein